MRKRSSRWRLKCRAPVSASFLCCFIFQLHFYSLNYWDFSSNLVLLRAFALIKFGFTLVYCNLARGITAFFFFFPLFFPVLHSEWIMLSTFFIKSPPPCSRISIDFASSSEQRSNPQLSLWDPLQSEQRNGMVPYAVRILDVWDTFSKSIPASYIGLFLKGTSASSHLLGPYLAHRKSSL